MKLIRFGAFGKEKPGVCIEGKNYDVSAFVKDYDEQFFAENGLQTLASILEEKKGSLQEIAADSRIGSPVARPSKIICIGLNYADHAKETNATPPTEPVIFMKASTALCGPYDNVVIPRDSEKTDWEVELAVVIGTQASYVETSDAMNYVAGYCLHNDVSERAFQLEMGGTWDKGKGCDSFAPMGPWLVTKDEVADVHQLGLWLNVNGKQMQKSTTAQLIFSIPVLVAYVSRFMTLLPGDIISTGTPAGVGLGFNPPIYLKDGDVMELGIDLLGSSKQTAVAYRAS